MIATVFSFLFPSLVIMVLLQMGTHRLNWKTVGWRPALILFLVSVLIASFPVKGLPLGRWLYSFNANFSITLTALLFCRVWQKAMEIKLFRPIDFQAAWIFSAITGLVLYPMALGMGPFDPYAAGWGFSWLSVTILMITIILAFLKNRFALVLLLAVLAWNLRLLESRNLWDYLTDPFLTIFSLVMVTMRGIESLRKRAFRETR
jgi:hypothetical protein